MDAHRIVRLASLLMLAAGMMIMPAAAMKDPSAVYCEALGYDFTTLATEEGEQGLCTLPDGRVDAWQFLQGKAGFTIRLNLPLGVYKIVHGLEPGLDHFPFPGRDAQLLLEAFHCLLPPLHHMLPHELLALSASGITHFFHESLGLPHSFLPSPMQFGIRSRGA